MEGQTAVVTGATRGIGSAVARAFAEAGAQVVICSREREALETVAEEIREGGGEAVPKRADVRDEFDVELLMETAAQEGEKIDCVVANAGVYHGTPGETPLSGESYAAFDDHVRTNARGVFTTIRESLPHLAEDARILVTSGAVARKSAAGYGSYAVSKAAAEAVARGFAADTGYGVAIVDPGVVATELTGGKGHDPEDVTEQFLWTVTNAPADLLDGSVIDRKTWRTHSRE